MTKAVQTIRYSDAFIDCTCHGFGHGFRLSRMDFNDGDPPWLALESNLLPPPSLWERIKAVFLGYYSCKYAAFEHIYTPEGARKHRDILDQYLQTVARHGEEAKK